MPLSIVLRLPLWYLLIYLPFFVAMGAVKLYADVICETYLGSVPSYGRSLLKLFLSLTAVLLAVPVIAALHVLAGTGRGTGGGDPGRVSGSSAAYAGREQEFFPDGSGGVKK